MNENSKSNTLAPSKVRTILLAICILAIVGIAILGYRLATVEHGHMVENTTSHSVTVNVQCANGSTVQVTISAYSTIEVSQYCENR